MLHRRLPISRIVAASLSVATLAGCGGETTAPAPVLSVSVSLDRLVGPTLSVDPNGQQLIACEFRFAAVATGEGSAAWENGLARFFVGKDRAFAIDSLPIAKRDIVESWGDTAIVPGSRQVSGWWGLGTTIPFAVSLEYHYRANGGSVKSTTAKVDCGPPIPAGAAAPAIANVSIDAPASDLQPGDTLTIRYTATSPVGLWRTTAFVSGPCEVSRETNEPLLTSSSRAVKIVLPSTCEIGPEVSVAVFATDAADQTTSRHITTPYSLVDETPPLVSVVSNSRWGTGPTTQLRGTYFTGDTLDLQVRARDNSMVQMIVWDAFQGRVRDSITVGAASVDQRVRIPIPKDWLGPVDLRVIARDAARNASVPVVAQPGAIEVFPTIVRPTRTVVSSIAVEDVVIDTVRGNAYLMEYAYSQQRVSILSLSQGRVTGTIELSSRPVAMDLSPGGDSLIVALDTEGALGVVDLRKTPYTVSKVALDGFDPYTTTYIVFMRTVSTGKTMLVASSPTSSTGASMLEVDLAAGTQRVRTEATADAALWSVNGERSGDHSTLTIIKDRCMGRFDAASDAFLPCRRLDVDYGPLAVDRTGARVLAGLDVYDASGQRLRTLDRPFHLNTPMQTTISPDGADAYYGMGSSGIAHVRVGDGRLVERLLTPTGIGRVFVSPDGKWLLGLAGAGAPSDLTIVDLTGPATAPATSRR